MVLLDTFNKSMKIVMLKQRQNLLVPSLSNFKNDHFHVQFN